MGFSWIRKTSILFSNILREASSMSISLRRKHTLNMKQNKLYCLLSMLSVIFIAQASSTEISSLKTLYILKNRESKFLRSLILGFHKSSVMKLSCQLQLELLYIWLQRFIWARNIRKLSIYGLLALYFISYSVDTHLFKVRVKLNFKNK